MSQISTVSVVIPLYNHVKYIEAAIVSVLSQTVRPTEIIVIDDGSIDGSGDVVRQYSQNHPDIIFWAWPNQGTHHTLNAGVLRATGDFVAILNSDDCYAPNRLAECLAVVDADSSVDVVTTRILSVDEQDREVPNLWYDDALAFYKLEGQLALALFNANFLVTTSNLFIRRSVFESIGYFSPLRYTHDLEFCLRLVLGNRRIFFLDKPLLRYRFHGQNTISESKQREDIERAAVFAYFLFRQRRVETNGALRATQDRYVDVLGDQGLLSDVETFVAILEKQPTQLSLAVAGSLPAEFQQFLSRLGVNWVVADSDDPLLNRLVVARNAFVRRQKLTGGDSRRVAQLTADNQWLTEQRDAWKKTVADQEDQIRSLNRAMDEQEDWAREQSNWLRDQLKDSNAQLEGTNARVEELRANNAWLIDQRDAWEKLTRDMEERVKTLTAERDDLRAGNAWLEGQRLAWEQLAGERERVINDLASRHQQSVETVASLFQLQAERDANLSALLPERAQFLGSKSWVVTRPLRFVQRRLVSPSYAFMRNALKRQDRTVVPEKSVARNEPLAMDMESSQRILLVLHEVSLSGAPRAVLYLARAIFSLYGVRPVVITPLAGPMAEEFRQEGFVVIVYPTLFEPPELSSAITEFVAGFERVIVTPLASFPFVRNFKDSAKRMTWWIHEVDQGFSYVAERFAPDLASLFNSCEAIWLGSPLCFQPASQHAPKERLHLLLYGCDDLAAPHRANWSGRMVFSLVGSVEPRKGQDIFLDAIEQLPGENRRNAIFRIIGSPYNDWSAQFYERICSRARTIPEVECISNVPFQRLRDLYSETDVVVSASRADTMPISITEGLMFSRVCLCSSAIGQAHLLEDKKDGLMFTSESAAELAERMLWLLNHPAELSILGAAGRMVYEKHFLMTSFTNNVARLLN
ncbi:MAG: glycosyltransferase [Rhodocyclaceae bacterium]|nr:MAG: glycosyltransferase [Rhodocyclaceae bacterium]